MAFPLKINGNPMRSMSTATPRCRGCCEGARGCRHHVGRRPEWQGQQADIVKQLEEESKKPRVVARNDGDAGKALAEAAQPLEVIYQAPFRDGEQPEIDPDRHGRKGRPVAVRKPSPPSWATSVNPGVGGGTLLGLRADLAQSMSRSLMTI